MEVPMTFCGYHPSMSAGLLTFGEGVARSTLQKARDAGRDVASHTEVELQQLAVLRDQLVRAESQAATPEAQTRATVLKSLATLCEVCFIGARGINDEAEFQDFFESRFDEFGELIKRLEDAYEGCLAGTSIEERTKVGVDAAILPTSSVDARALGVS
jgi:hypothetical protein